MIDVDALVAFELDRLLPLPSGDRADWQDVVERAGRRRESRLRRIVRPRKRVALAGLSLAALVAAVVAAAYALGHPIISFDSAPRASSRTVVDYFGRMTIGVPKGIPVLPHEARRITTVRVDGREHVLWIAPAKDGGFCYAWSGSSNGCQLGHQPRSADVTGELQSSTAGGPERLTSVGGSFPEARVARVVVTYADDERDDVPFVWVTQPIDSGFFLFGIPRSHRLPGHQPVRLLLLDSAGALVAARPLGGESAPERLLPYKLVPHRLPGYARMLVPAPAEWEHRRQVFDWRSGNGTHIGLWIAPSTAGGTCYWSNIHSGCSQDEPNWPKIRHGAGYVGLCCTIDPNAARVDVFFEDGDRVTLEPKRGYLIWPIPKRHYPPGHRLDKLVTYDARGHELGSLDVFTGIRALYPCARPKDYGYGLVMCP